MASGLNIKPHSFVQTPLDHFTFAASMQNRAGRLGCGSCSLLINIYIYIYIRINIYIYTHILFLYIYNIQYFQLQYVSRVL